MRCSRRIVLLLPAWCSRPSHSVISSRLSSSQPFVGSNITIVPRRDIQTRNMSGVATAADAALEQLYQPKKRDFEESLAALNTLQSNEAVIAAWVASRRINTNVNLYDEMMDCVSRLNLDLDNLSVIHVAGTKGKGSVCSMVESILRNNGYRTGLYTSPHLISVRERISLNGRILDKEVFARYFWDVWDTLAATRNARFPSMPSFFRFLTLMALHVFEKEGIDAAIVEVGVGGRADATNLFTATSLAASAITSLGYDHMNVLGDTLASIAFEKAGIMKENVPVFTVPQLDEAMNVLQERSQIVKAPLVLVPPLESYLSAGESVEQLTLGLQGEHQRTNASLAIALSNVWLATSKYARGDHKTAKFVPTLNNYDESLVAPLTTPTRRGLASCNWPGRAQVLQVADAPNLTLFLDGAHTPESIQVCASWFANREVANNNKEKSVHGHDAAPLRFLVFHCGSGRDPAVLMAPLVDKAGGHFDKAFFTTFVVHPPSTSTSAAATSSTTTATATPTTVLVRNKADNDAKWQQHVVETWQKLNASTTPSTTAITTTTASTPPTISTEVFPSITDTINRIKQLAHTDPHKEIHVLVTGSLYLVGGVLEVVNYTIL